MGKKINLSHNLMGCRLDNWLRLKKSNPITAENKAQARLITASVVGSGSSGIFGMAGLLCADQTDKNQKDPVYIVGYWRSGTTFLQNLLTRDPQFGWFDPVRTVTFSNCIFMKGILAKAQKKLLQGARPMDNLEYTLDLPMEEVFAQATISTQAISHMLVFPDGGKGVKYIETAFIDEQDEKRQQEWRKVYDYILKKDDVSVRGQTASAEKPGKYMQDRCFEKMLSGSKIYQYLPQSVYRCHVHHQYVYQGNGAVLLK